MTLDFPFMEILKLLFVPVEKLIQIVTRKTLNRGQLHSAHPVSCERSHYVSDGSQRPPCLPSDRPRSPTMAHKIVSNEFTPLSEYVIVIYSNSDAAISVTF